MMKALQQRAALVVAVAVLFGPGAAGASDDPLPEPASCSYGIDGDVLTVEWAPVPDADKYSIEVTGLITVGGDTELPEGANLYSWDVGAPGEVATYSTNGNITATVSLSDLVVQGTEDTYQADEYTGVRVKGLNPGKGKGHQNHLFVDCVAQ